MLFNRIQRAPGRALALLVGAFLVLPTYAGASASGPVSAIGAGTERVAVVDLTQPQTLPVGAPPATAYLDHARSGSPIYRPGRSALAVGSGRSVSHLMRVRGGYIVTIGSQTVRFVGADRRRETLAQVAFPEFVEDALASADGRLVAIIVARSRGRHDRIEIRRIADQHLVVRRSFKTPVTVAALSRKRALVTPEPCGGCSRELFTKWWNLRTDRLRVIDQAPRPRVSGGVSSPGDLSAAQVAVVRGDHDRVITLPRHPSRAWHTDSGEWVLSWSPDDRFVLTVAQFTEAGWEYVAVRRASTGTVVARFRVDVEYADLWAPVWEDASTISFTDGYECGDGTCDHAIAVRCTVHGTCEQVKQPPGVLLAEERRLPPT